MTRMGLTLRQCEDLIYQLSFADYVNGPVPDELYPGQYWVFGLNVDEEELYIKLKISMKPNGDEMGICYSFHISEFPMSYPLKQ